MNELFSLLRESEKINEIREELASGHTPVLITGVSDVAESAIISAVNENSADFSVVVAPDEAYARRIFSDMLNFDENALYLPAADIEEYFADASVRASAAQRIETLFKIVKGATKTVVMPAEALLNRVSPKDRLLESLTEIKPGDVIEPEELVKTLISRGYELSDKAEGQGQFARRGGILDIFPVTWENPLRIEFWDDEIDSLRLLDTETMRSLENLQSAVIFPAKEILPNEEEKAAAFKNINSEYEKTLKKMEKTENLKAAENLRANVGEALEKFRRGGDFPRESLYADLLFGERSTVFDYFPENTVIHFVEWGRIKERLSFVRDSFAEAAMSRAEAGFLLTSRVNALLTEEDVLRLAGNFPQTVFSFLRSSLPDFSIKARVGFSVKAAASFRSRADLFGQEVSYLKKEGYAVLVFTKSGTFAERIHNELDEQGISSILCTKGGESPQRGQVYISMGNLSAGFVLDDAKAAVFTDTELLGRSVSRKKPKSKRKKANAIESFTELKPGDYIVHETYGIGAFKGLENIDLEGVSKDYLKIEYAAGGSLFIPVSQMDMIQKYIGSEGAAPKLSKLGGADWERAKTKARKTVSILARDLISLYAKRQAAVGFSYSEDTPWQREFEETFPYEETEDQLSAIEDVKRDMESSRVMDRLLCGDVGYGKTEVALRAAFKAVQDSRQTAVLVPTTILAMQHFSTFTERMKGYPVNIQVLSRFRTASEIKKTLEDVKNGICDIVIGTHRLLSKDVSFKDLGLIIIDEEQKFGVAHKEKLKKFRENVDVLALSATPIPRTLHMSLSGIRDMSLLDEPPEERQVVRTYVMEYEDFVVKEAILRELNRGGQVFYVHNRVMDMERTVRRLRELVPEAKIGFANGQMPESLIEDTMKSFLDREIDVLVCTTIIENGVDMPRVNTIIVEDADKMGLSQLYQLRGRVGRSRALAYAYMLYRKDKIITEEAEKRLKTIKEFTEFGAGFKIAMKDLEIRGAGMLLGAEQHGSMDVVGYDMYCRILKEEIDRLKGEKPEEKDFETTVDLNINAFIPSYYIRDEETRLNVYKRAAGIGNLEEYYDVQEEIEDKYGTAPKPVEKLLEVIHLKANAHRAGIREITEKAAFISLKINEENSLKFDVLMDMVTKEPLKYGINPKDPLEFIIKTDRFPKKGKFFDSADIVRDFLKKAADFE